MTDQEQWKWTRPSWLRREYVLSNQREELARIVFNAWGAGATVVMPGANWTISRAGLWKARVTIRSVSSHESLACARAFWTGNYDLEAPIGTAFRWTCLSIWKMQYGWTRFDGTPVISYKPAAAFSHRRYTIEFAEDAPAESRLLLTILGGYLLAVTQDDMAATAVAVSG